MSVVKSETDVYTCQLSHMRIKNIDQDKFSFLYYLFILNVHYHINGKN